MIPNLLKHHTSAAWDTKEEAEAGRCVRRYQFAVTAPGQHSTSKLNDLPIRRSPDFARFLG